MTDPVINAGEFGSALSYTPLCSDEFDEDGAGPGSNWIYDDLSDGLNRTGSQGQDENGNIDPNRSASGKRWAAYTNGNNDSFVSRENGILKVGGFVENAADPTRESYTHNGTFYDWANRRFYAPYFGTWKRTYSDEANGHIQDPESQGFAFGPGHYVEARVNFSQMKTRGFRCSIWFMPIEPNASNAYTSDPATGNEKDLFEYENWSNDGFNAFDVLQQKVIAGAAGTTSTAASPGGNVDVSQFGLESGWHTIGMLWRTDGVYWFVDGVETIRETTRVSQVLQSPWITREINSGVKDVPANSAEIPSDGVKRPQDVGLYAVSAILDESLINDDYAQIDYLRVWSVDGDNGQSQNLLPGEFGSVTVPTDPSGATNTTNATGYRPVLGDGVRFAPSHGAGIVEYFLANPEDHMPGRWNYDVLTTHNVSNCRRCFAPCSEIDSRSRAHRKAARAGC